MFDGPVPCIIAYWYPSNEACAEGAIILICFCADCAWNGKILPKFVPPSFNALMYVCIYINTNKHKIWYEYNNWTS